MTVTVNEKLLELAPESTLADALKADGIAPQGIATALNGVVVPAAKRALTRLNDGDAVLVIQAFYGG